MSNFSYVMKRTSYILMRGWCPLCTNSLKQQSAGRHVSPFGYVILIPSQPVFALTLKWCVLSEEATSTNIIVFGGPDLCSNPRSTTLESSMRQPLHHRCSFTWLNSNDILAITKGPNICIEFINFLMSLISLLHQISPHHIFSINNFKFYMLRVIDIKVICDQKQISMVCCYVTFGSNLSKL